MSTNGYEIYILTVLVCLHFYGLEDPIVTAIAALHNKTNAKTEKNNNFLFGDLNASYAT